MKKMNRGFSLFELMIVIVIVGVVAAIAVPSYQSSLIRGYRQDAKSTLLLVAQKMEQKYTIDNLYAADLTTANGLLTTWGLNTASSNKYNISFTSVSATTYVVQAVAVGAQQLKDKGTGYDCTALYLDYRGLKGTASASTVDKIDNRSTATQTCWGK